MSGVLQNPEDWAELGRRVRNAFRALSDADFKILWVHSEDPEASTYGLYSGKRPVVSARQTAYESVERLSRKWYMRRKGSRTSSKNPGIKVIQHELTAKGHYAAMGTWALDSDALKSIPSSKWLGRVLTRSRTVESTLLWNLFFFQQINLLPIDLDQVGLDFEEQAELLFKAAVGLDVEGAKGVIRKLGLEPAANFEEVVERCRRIALLFVGQSKRKALLRTMSYTS